MTKEDIEKILQKYECTPTGISGAFGEGVSSAVVALETKEHGTVILKESDWYGFVCEADAIAALEEVSMVSMLLRRGGVRIPEMILNSEGTYVVVHTGQKYILQKMFEGSSFNHSPEHIYALGKTLGIFHRVGKELLTERASLEREVVNLVPVEKSYENSRTLYHSELKPFLQNTHKCSLAYVCDAVRDDVPFIETCMERVDHAQVQGEMYTKTILHNDLNTRNILFDNNLVGIVIDTDQLNVGSCIMDIANTLNSFTWKFVEEDVSVLPAATEMYLRGYHSEHPLPVGEYAGLVPAGLRWDLMRILRSLRRHHFENNRFPELTANISKRFLPRLHSTAENFSFLTEEWVKESIFKN